MKTTLKIKRPTGETEIVDISERFPVGITGKIFAKIVEANRKAGRGEVLSYTMEAEAPTLDAQRFALVCEIENAREAANKAIHNDGFGYNAAKAKIESSVEALRKFDAEHPEIVAEIQRKRAEEEAQLQTEIERNFWR